MTLRFMAVATAIGATLLGGTGCGLIGRSTGANGQFGAPILLQRGRVIAVRDVSLKAPPSTLSQDRQAVGVVVKGPASDRAAEKFVQEITVELETGKTIVVVQEGDGTPFAPDDRVLVQTGGTVAPRVLRTERVAGF